MSKHTFLVIEEITRSQLVELEIPYDLTSDDFDEYVTWHVYEQAARNANWDEQVMETDWELEE